MNEDYKERWVNALLSGEYKQGSGYLKAIDKEGVLRHCCLGVACEVFKEEISLGEREIPGENMYDNPRKVHLFSGMAEYLPRELKYLLEIYTDIETELVRMNDDKRSFVDIAEWIRNNV